MSNFVPPRVVYLEVFRRSVSPPIRLVGCPVFVLSGHIKLQAESYMYNTMLCMRQREIRLQLGAQQFLNADEQKIWATERERIQT